MKAYVVKDGHRFVQPGGEVIEAGGIVHLDDEAAERHAARIEPARKPKKVAEKAPDSGKATKAK
jgi:hypothetical protein